MMVRQWGAALLLPLLVVVNGGWLLLLQLPTLVDAQNGLFAPAPAPAPATAAVTASAEAEAFLALFKKWNITSRINWNTTEDVCSGGALANSTTIDSDNATAIRCDCSDDKGNTCHITALKVDSLDIVGEIPDELWKMTFLTYLRMNNNYLTGSISPSIGNLKKLEKLYFGYNALSGTLSKELGQLIGLKELTFETNNFSGSLPSELGNIVGLQTLYIDSSGVSGPIPSSFAKLVNLKNFVASDTELNGNIPDFIGNWSKLINLRLQGNSFVGSIPSSFANLTALQTLRIGDLSNGSSSLAFITNLTSLINLELRNINFSDRIPSGIGGLIHLKYLDLSFNSIRGRIPDPLFSLVSLQYLFLGDNKLTGSLPQSKNPSLINIDVSYNELSGNLPSWTNQRHLQINLVANNFTITNGDALRSGLNCLQNNFRCSDALPLGSPNSSFAVKCGGKQIKSSDGTEYQTENENLSPAAYYVVNTNKWAVSIAGHAKAISAILFKANSSLPISNTSDQEIFQTTRLSPGSLRYYGLGLENGNYTVLLQFAELLIQNGKTWKSLGRRVFDIYIQRHRVVKNFDIRKEARGQSFSAVIKNFTAQVMGNYLEIHLVWAGKGTCCVPMLGTYGPSISAISVTPNFTPTRPNGPPSAKDKTGLVLAIVLPFGCLCLLLVGYYVIQKRRRLQAARDEELMGVESKPYIFSYTELKSATKDFNPSNKLGEGGFGPVYKGTLNDGRVVAVKQLSFKSKQGKRQFVAEIATISAVQHRNLIKLYGCCIEGNKRLLVYEFLENGSLDQALFAQKGILLLNWAKRFEICMGVARGLSYLHHESRVCIVHRDVKASNILLDSELNPKISDFGLAKLYDEKATHITTGFAGTMGYAAPEYALRGYLTEKVDVFSFGILALEIVSGRANFDSTLDREKAHLLQWTWQLYESNREVELVDGNVEDFDKEEVKRVVRVALFCTQASPGQRPAMSRVVAMLSGDAEVGDGVVPTKPGYLTDFKYEDSNYQSSTGPKTEGASVATTSTTNLLLDSFISMEEGR